MATYQITKVRTETPYGASHEHIMAVELSNRVDQRFSRSTIVSDLKSPEGDRFYTYGGGECAEVVLRRCPTCSASDYITTLPDSTTKNNLLRLPRF
jgi:hypothetical protein